MRVVVYEFMSLDGVVQGPGAKTEDTDGGFENGGWSIPYFDLGMMGPVIFGSLEGVEALLFGRRTWTSMADAWPGRAGDPYADAMNALPKHVASRTLADADMRWNSTLLPADGALDAVADLRAREGGDLQTWGSPSLVSAMLSRGLVDELNLFIEPVVLGGGKRIFPEDGTMLPLELVSATTTGTGVQMCRYRPTA